MIPCAAKRRNENGARWQEPPAPTVTWPHAAPDDALVPRKDPAICPMLNAIDKAHVAYHNDLVKSRIMLSLCGTVLLILTGLLAMTVVLWLISSDSALRIASEKFEPARNARTQRYLQFSGMPGVMLYGFREEYSAIDPEKAGVPRWILELRALRRDEIEEREKASTSPEGRNRPRLVLGYSSESHGKPGSAFFAVYRYFSLPALTALWAALIAGLGGLLYLIKHTSADCVCQAIREVHKGNTFFSPSIPKRLQKRKQSK
jgi:hypothetical protein